MLPASGGRESWRLNRCVAAQVAHPRPGAETPIAQCKLNAQYSTMYLRSHDSVMIKSKAV